MNIYPILTCSNETILNKIIKYRNTYVLLINIKIMHFQSSKQADHAGWGKSFCDNISYSFRQNSIHEDC